MKISGTAPLGRQGAESSVYSRTTRFGQVFSNVIAGRANIAAPFLQFSVVGPGDPFPYQPNPYSKIYLALYGHGWSLLTPTQKAAWNLLASSKPFSSWRYSTLRLGPGYYLYVCLNMINTMKPIARPHPLDPPPFGTTFDTAPPSLLDIPTVTSLTVTDAHPATPTVTVTWNTTSAPNYRVYLYLSRAKQQRTLVNPPCTRFHVGTYFSGDTSATSVLTAIYYALDPTPLAGESVVWAARVASADVFGRSYVPSPPYAIPHTISTI
jgi:hypothetical protein